MEPAQLAGMNVQWPTGLGAVLALVVLVLAILALVGALNAGATLVLALVAALALARLT